MLCLEDDVDQKAGTIKKRGNLMEDEGEPFK